jgi:hypothetical protein
MSHPEIHDAERVVLAAAERWRSASSSSTTMARSQDLIDAVDALTAARSRHQVLTPAQRTAVLDFLADLDAHEMASQLDKPHVVVTFDTDPVSVIHRGGAVLPIVHVKGPYPSAIEADAAAVLMDADLNRSSDEPPFVSVTAVAHEVDE